MSTQASSDGYTLGIESNQLKSWHCDIDGINLTYTQVLLIKIKESINNFNILGTFVFVDLTDIVSKLPLRGGNKITFNLKDFDDVEYNAIFYVIDIYLNMMENGNNIVSLKIIDEISYNTLKMYRHLSWNKCNILDIINHKKTLKDLIKDKKQDFFKPINIYNNFVMNLSVPFNSIIKYLAKKDNVKIFQTKDSFIIQPLEELNNKEPKGDKFIYKTPNIAYRRNIYHYKTNFGKVLQNTLLNPVTKNCSLDTENGIEEQDIVPNKNVNNLSSESGTSTEVQTETKYTYNPTFKSSSNEKSDRNTQKLLEIEMLVSGKYDNNIGDIVELDLVDTTEKITPEKNISGKWLITEIVNNYIQPDFFQKITLTRPKYFE